MGENKETLSTNDELDKGHENVSVSIIIYFLLLIFFSLG
jgi:hypothetical protein